MSWKEPTGSGFMIPLIPPDRRLSKHIQVDQYAHDVLRWGISIDNDKPLIRHFGLFIHRGQLTQRSCRYSLQYQNPIPFPVIEGLSMRPAVQCVRTEAELIGRGIRHYEYQTRLVDVGNIGQNACYTLEITLPSKVVLRLHLDTGTAFTWLFGEPYEIVGEQPTPLQCVSMQHSLYVPSHGDVIDLKNTFQLVYADGSSTHGHVCLSKLDFSTAISDGDNKEMPLRVWAMFGVAHAVSLLLATSPADGILGLGIKQLYNATTGQIPDTILFSLFSQSQIPEMQFCIGLQKSGQSFISIGTFPPISIAPEPRQWIILPRYYTHWVLEVSKVGWGDQPDDHFVTLSSDPFHLLLDSGANNCYLAQPIVAYVHHQLGGREGSLGYELPSSTHKQDKHIWFLIQDHWYSFSPEYFPAEICETAIPPRTSWHHSRLKDQGDQPGFSIMGVPFFEQYFIYFLQGEHDNRVALEDQLERR